VLTALEITAQLRSQITRLLGREPRGLEDVAVCNAAGDPMVIRVASLIDDKPFPTMFWLIDRDISYRIDVEEAGGLIQRLQARIDAAPELQRAMSSDHQAHIELRNSFLSTDTKMRLQELNFYEVLQKRGIGGIADVTRIRCLHTWYASHLVVGNTVGKLLEEHWEAPAEFIPPRCTS
jgi:hypothetical protein